MAVLFTCRDLPSGRTDEPVGFLGDFELFSLHLQQRQKARVVSRESVSLRFSSSQRISKFFAVSRSSSFAPSASHWADGISELSAELQGELLPKDMGLAVPSLITDILSPSQPRYPSEFSSSLTSFLLLGDLDSDGNVGFSFHLMGSDLFEIPNGVACVGILNASERLMLSEVPIPDVRHLATIDTLDCVSVISESVWEGSMSGMVLSVGFTTLYELAVVASCLVSLL